MINFRAVLELQFSGNLFQFDNPKKIKLLGITMDIYQEFIAFLFIQLWMFWSQGGETVLQGYGISDPDSKSCV